MPPRDPLNLIGKRLERRTGTGQVERGTIKELHEDGRVSVEMANGRIEVVNPEQDKEWTLLEEA